MTYIFNWSLLEVVVLIAGLTAGVHGTRLGNAHAAALRVGADGDSEIKIRADLGCAVLTHPGAASARGDLEGLTGAGSGKECGNT
jgi:hypothetical protein